MADACLKDVYRMNQSFADMKLMCNYNDHNTE